MTLTEFIYWSITLTTKNKLYQGFINTVKPPHWSENISSLESGYRNQDFIVWMRTSAFPFFKKLYGRILLEENSKLAYNKIAYSNETMFDSLLSLKSQFDRYLDGFNGLNQTHQLDKSNATRPPIHMIHKNAIQTLYRLPKGQYFVDIEYSKNIYRMSIIYT